MSATKLVAFLRALPEKQREEMIARMQPQEQAMIRSLLISAKDSNAAIIDEVAQELGGSAKGR